MTTTYQRWIERGILEGERRSALRQLDAKFGPLSSEVKQRVQGLSPDCSLTCFKPNPLRISAWWTDDRVVCGNP
jgi:hypothetical protein